MTTLSRWEPFRELATLRSAMDRLFDEPFLETSRLLSTPTTELAPALDVKEEDDAYVVTASVPGVKPEDVEVTISDNILTIKGASSEETEVEEDNYHLRERRSGSFSRRLILPAMVKSDNVEATQEDGVLTLRLPKSEEIKPKKIEVKASTNGTTKKK